MKYSITYLASAIANETLKPRSIEIMDAFLGNESFQFVDEGSPILFIASGGTERLASKVAGGFINITLLCHRESNSFAATMEIAAFLRSQGKRVSLIDVFDSGSKEEFSSLQKIYTALDNLNLERAAILGEVSDWLIVSDVEDELIKNKLGIDILRLPWTEIGDHKDKKPSVDFLKYFPNHPQQNLIETAKVYSLLEELITKENLTAISVECFSMVMRDKVTACLPLAVLNSQNIVAACEGDLVSMLGKIMIRALTDQIPWQANIAEIKEDQILLAHCTAPLNLLNSFEITTHFETGVGTAVRGTFPKEKVGVFRVNNQLDKYMLIEGEITNTPQHGFACRTQIELTTTPEQTQKLKDKALGNHHLVFPIENAPLLKRMMKILEIAKV